MQSTSLKYRKTWKRIVVAMIFVVRTFVLFAGVLRVGVLRQLRPLVPQRLQEWWTRFGS